MPNYFSPEVLEELNLARQQIYNIREDIYKKYKTDILDTDALSSLSIYEIVCQYDKDYNINFSRNGEDAKSKDILIEQKAARVDGMYTSTGKLRKNAGRDAAFLFHAMGDIEHQRYLFVARNKVDLQVVRIYDIADMDNRQKILNKLLVERNNWLLRGKENAIKMKHDVIAIPESFLIDSLNLPYSLEINNCKIHKDW